MTDSSKTLESSLKQSKNPIAETIKKQNAHLKNISKVVRGQSANIYRKKRNSAQSSFDRYGKVFLHEFTEIKERVVPQITRETMKIDVWRKRKMNADLNIRYVGDIENKRAKQITRVNRHGTLDTYEQPKKKRTVRRVRRSSRPNNLSHTDKSLNDRMTETMRSLNQTIVPPSPQKQPEKVRTESHDYRSMHLASQERAWRL